MEKGSRQSIMSDRLLTLVGRYLNETPDAISSDMIDEMASLHMQKEEAYKLLFASLLGLDIAYNAQDKALYREFFPHMLHRLDAEKYQADAYYRHIAIPDTHIGNWELKKESYKPWEAFVCNDFLKTSDGRTIPQIGYFDKAFSFPAVTEDGRLWMSVTPNEIETMRKPIAMAHGHVLTYGLGLGYYAFHVAEKQEVSRVTIVEQSADVIGLFKNVILKQFSCADKIDVIQADAFRFAQDQMAQGDFDFVFTDLWHDVSDGLPMYLKMRANEKRLPKARFMYWIEDTIRCYL